MYFYIVLYIYIIFIYFFIYLSMYLFIYIYIYIHTHNSIVNGGYNKLMMVYPAGPILFLINVNFGSSWHETYLSPPPLTQMEASSNGGTPFVIHVGFFHHKPTILGSWWRKKTLRRSVIVLRVAKLVFGKRWCLGQRNAGAGWIDHNVLRRGFSPNVAESWVSSSWQCGGFLEWGYPKWNVL